MKKSIFYMIMFMAAMLTLVTALTDIIIKCGMANSQWADTKIWGNVNGNLLDVCLLIVGGFGSLVFLKRALDIENFRKKETEQPFEVRLRNSYKETNKSIKRVSDMLVEMNSPEAIDTLSKIINKLYQTRDAIEFAAFNNNISLTDDTPTS